MSRRYEILEALPSYGKMYVSVAKNDEPFYSDEGLAVRFYRADRTDWIGNFKPGYANDFSGIYEFKESMNLLVISQGCCYTVNPDEIKPLSIFSTGYSDVFETRKGRIILNDKGDIFVVEANGNYCYTEICTSEDLTNLKLVNNIFQSLAFYPRQDADEWIEYTFNLGLKPKSI